MPTLNEASKKFFKSFMSKERAQAELDAGDILCFVNALEKFLESGRKEDAFTVYFCFSEIFKLFGRGYKNTQKLLEMLSDHEYYPFTEKDELRMRQLLAQCVVCKPIPDPFTPMPRPANISLISAPSSSCFGTGRRRRSTIRTIIPSTAAKHTIRSEWRTKRSIPKTVSTSSAANAEKARR